MDVKLAERYPESLPPSTLPNGQGRPFGLYIHIPFCEKKCPYCDFNTYARLDTLFDAYIDALCLELRYWARRLDHRPVDTIFLGGGTPTLLDARALARLFETVYEAFPLVDGCEITSEANPGTVDQEKFRVLHDLGVNRLSMGVQSFQPDELNFLGRIHSVEDVYQAFDAARRAGFANINLDFIFGLPHQTVDQWQETLAEATSLGPEHLSLYSLIVEPNTPLFQWVQSGRVDAPDDDDAGLLYELAMAHMASAGYSHYEVSNWAKPGATDGGEVALQACRHNLIYWRNQEYLGVGPGAHSFLYADAPGWPAGEDVIGFRWSNRKPVPGYIKRMLAGDTVEDFREAIETPVSMGETMMLGLRLIQEGVSLARFYNRYGIDLTTMFAAEIERLQKMELLTLDATAIRLTTRGLMVGNQVFAEFLP